MILVIPSEVEESRGVRFRQRSGILRLRCAPLRMTERDAAVPFANQHDEQSY
jgi:hypothetical protein